MSLPWGCVASVRRSPYLECQLAECLSLRLRTAGCKAAPKVRVPMNRRQGNAFNCPIVSVSVVSGDSVSSRVVVVPLGLVDEGGYGVKGE